MAVRNLPTFAKQMRIRARYITKNSDRLVGQVAVAVTKRLLDATPVDTGRARTNWRTVFYVPTEPLYYPRPDKPPDPSWAYDRALSEAMVTAAQYKGRRSIYVVNNVPYIEYLDKGTARIPAGNFLELAFHTANQEVREHAPLLSRPVEATIMMKEGE